MSSVRKGTARLPHSDLAEALRPRLNADLAAETAAAQERGRVAVLETHSAKLEAALAAAETLGRQRLQEAEIATNRVVDLKAHIATLEATLATAEALGRKRQQEAEIAAQRADELVAQLFKVTNELVEMSKQMAERAALTDKLRAEFDDYRLRSWWWQHGMG
jgi:hypothetical protein